MNIDNSELEDYVRSCITAIDKGLSGSDLQSDQGIEIKVALVCERVERNNLRVRIADKQLTKSASLMHIKFKASPRQEAKSEPVVQIVHFSSTQKNESSQEGKT